MYFEKADKGEQIIIQRGKDKAYVLIPVSEDDIYFNAEMVKKIWLSIEQVKKEKVKKVTTSKGISDLLGIH